MMDKSKKDPPLGIELAVARIGEVHVLELLVEEMQKKKEKPWRIM